jgi:hypothetical protein
LDAVLDAFWLIGLPAMRKQEYLFERDLEVAMQFFNLYGKAVRGCPDDVDTFFSKKKVLSGK